MTRTFRLSVAAAVMAMSIAADTSAESASYLGANKCKPCHLKQYTSWQKTRMAQAFELLKPGVRATEKRLAKLDPAKDYTGDPTCLSCHVTGYLQPGGFKSMAATPGLAGVQCESCHGPGSLYTAKDRMSLQNKEYKRQTVVAAGLVVPTAATCTSLCHNEKSPFMKPGAPFDFEKRKREGSHEHVPLKFQH